MRTDNKDGGVSAKLGYLFKTGMGNKEAEHRLSVKERLSSGATGSRLSLQRTSGDTRLKFP